MSVIIKQKIGRGSAMEFKVENKARNIIEKKGGNLVIKKEISCG
ncbi:hypothetical protein REC12_10605 [Desulfosporosinus sp. PR]|nr:hypothetical protein [Desulfosporosinus sp. PR]